MDHPTQRKHSRFKLSVPVEMCAEGSDTPMRCATSDICLGGCYVESMYPLPVGTCIELKLQLEGTLLIVARVVTSDPQVGNGIEFVRILPEDLDELRAFLDCAAKHETAEIEKSD